MLHRLLPYALLSVFGLVAFSVLSITRCRSRENARRASCQSTLKQIGLALQQYAQDYDDHLPRARWTTVLSPYTHVPPVDVSFFQCPAAEPATTANDYFFNARYLNGRLRDIEDPARLVLIGDGTNDAAFDVTLGLFPSAWRHDKNSPAWRHLETANYLFADGHVKALRVGAVKPDFKWGNS